MKENILGWIGTIAITIAVIARAFDYSHTLDLIFTFIGCASWVLEGIRIKNTPLILVNLFSCLMIFAGALWVYFV